jgi:hypothetical protein
VLKRAYEWITVSAGERWLEHQEREKDGLKERKKARDGQRRASEEEMKVSDNKI